MDTLFVNGSVFDGRQHRPGLAVGVSAGRIAAVAPDLSGFRSAKTEVVDLAGRLLLPGFTDAHVHPVQGGVERARLRPDRRHRADGTWTGCAGSRRAPRAGLDRRRRLAQGVLRGRRCRPPPRWTRSSRTGR